MDKTIEQDDKIIKLLDLKEIRRIVCDTDKGYLKLLIRKGENKYHLELDSVPLEPNLNKELMDLLFTNKIEIPQVKKEPFGSIDSLPSSKLKDSSKESKTVKKNGKIK